MDTSNLLLFAKDRESTEAHRGYIYQNLKALETWLSNKLLKNQDRLYCDYGDDIFQHDAAGYKAKFRQIKLYTSKTFSFSSEEIKKALAHFFFLNQSKEFLFEEAEFVFEVNTGVARQYGDNDATLLTEWVANQGQLTSTQAQKCAAKVKEVLQDYIQKRKKELSGSVESGFLHQGVTEFESLDEKFWASFANSIRWTFTSLPPEDELAKVIKSINDKISELQFPISAAEGGIDKIFSAFYSEVGLRSIAPEPQNRCLTSRLMDHVLLNLGDSADRQYSEALKKWQQVIIRQLYIGEFYEVLHAANHCRRLSHLEDHSNQWRDLLLQYIQLEEIPENLRQEAIYELIWITVRPTIVPEEFKLRSAIGLEDVIRSYFEQFEKFDSVSDIENTLSLLTVVRTLNQHDQLQLKPEEIAIWIKRYSGFIGNEIQKANESNRLCYLMESKAFFKLNEMLWQEENDVEPTQVVEELEKIIPLLINATRYPVHQLCTKIENMLGLLHKLGTRRELAKELTAFLDRLEPHDNERLTSFNRAKKFIQRGADLITSQDPKALLQSLDYFHKAKELYYEDQVMEGYVLGLLNITQIYMSLGLNFAAKYHSLSAAWTCFNQEDSQLYKRIADSHLLAFLTDFHEGAWINALYSFYDYINSRHEFTTEDYNIEEDKFQKAVFAAATIFGVTPKLVPEMKHFIEFQKSRVDRFYSEFIQPSDKLFENMPEAKAMEVLNGKITGLPFNDIGPIRTVGWKALNIDWRVSFSNNYLSNSIAEEFCSLLQITSAELATFSNITYDMTSVKVEVSLSSAIKAPEVNKSSGVCEVKVFLKHLDKATLQEVNMYYGALSSAIHQIVKSIATLSEKEADSLLDNLFRENNLGKKGMTFTSYQGLFRTLTPEGTFAESQREKFNPVRIERILPQHPSLKTIHADQPAQ